MNKLLLFLIIFVQLMVNIYLECSFSKNFTLINKKYISNFLNKDAPWSGSHGAENNYLGAGLLYYCLAYMQQARLCVCLGSGGGFVPRVMRQAQRDLDISLSKTVLVDANIGDYGRPQWLSPDSFFNKEFPDIEIILKKTHDVALNEGKGWQIDYLHIDADHSFEGALQDFRDYLPLMAANGVITIHDTDGSLPCSKVIDVVIEEGFEVVNLRHLGAGIAIVLPKRKQFNEL